MIENASESSTNESTNFDSITYKDIKILTNYLSEQGKILPRRVTGLTSRNKKVAKLIKLRELLLYYRLLLVKVDKNNY